jgi:uncharacterized membrane protein
MSQRSLTIALIVSLVVNVFVIGAVVGAFGMRHKVETESMRPPRSGNPIMRVTEQLPEDLRARYMARMRAEGQNNRAKMAEARAARGEAMQAMSAETYDPAAAAAALARAREAEMVTRTSIEGAIVDFSRNLTQEQRRLIAQSLRGGPGGRGPRDGRRGDGPRGERGGGPERDGGGPPFDRPAPNGQQP